MDSKKRLTTDFGAPVPDDLHSRTAGQRGPTLMEDVHLLKKLAHFDRERIPERVVHAKGAGAGGYFELTRDISQYTCAKLFSQVGKKTEVFVRFSTVGGEKGSADAERDPRGFAVKFYTEDGNWDKGGQDTAPPPSPSERYDVFISYAHEDKNMAQKLCEALSQDGMSVWFDKAGGLNPGDPFEENIRWHIAHCRLFAPVLSSQIENRWEGFFRKEWK